MKTQKKIEITSIGKIYIAILLFTTSFNIAYGQTINVDAGMVIKSFDYNPVGININYLMDDDDMLNPAIGLQQSLSSMKVSTLRYPGGEKADNYLWSVPPYTSANPQFATVGNCNWPNNDSRFSANYINPLSTTLDFDEFMTLALSIDAKPLIVVAADAHYCTFCPDPPTLSDLILNAVEWVKYANIVKQYNIKYWMVGNESWHMAAYDNPSTALEYANDFIQFSQAMKSVDSSIVLVANTQKGEWLNTLLAQADGYIDAVAISNYPVWDWTNGYDTYRNGNPNFVENINSVITALGDRDISVIVTEYNSIDWNDTWSNNNDLGHALVNFQMFGDQIKIDKVISAYLWNSRWVDNATSPQHLFDAIDSDGSLNATGKALSIWGDNLLDKLVFSTNSGFINSFASVDSSGRKLNIFLINKNYSSHAVTVNIDNYQAIKNLGLSITETVFSGMSVTDKFPTITVPINNASLLDSTMTIQLKPLSITVIKMEGELTTHIKDIDSLEKPVVIFPNPVSNVLIVIHKNATTKPKELKIFNLQGIVVYTENVINQKTEIDVRDIPSGMYIIKIGNYQKRFIKH